ncbi:thioredoxin family protein [Chitinophaga sancti]|uniref:DUF899 domain-containing protein n=1 Tax=Chitinophaga sancti TaxID=1004 RepID=UPI002A7523B6|nr:thioredoxin family protein [Chitinophaga sancti]WPQ60712.1 thioredoxin family protein [Chitinophaga sancti]
MENRIVSHAEWVEARKAFLVKEKEYTHLRDQLAKERQALPWEKVDTNYVFDGPNGKMTLSDLFEGRSQLLVQHFMMGPEWKEGCVGCSFMADHVPGALLHLNNHDVSFAAISRAPIEAIEAFRKRMGWNFRWVSSGQNNFNFDYHVSFKKEDTVYYNYENSKFGGEELPGISVFYKDESGQIFHTYSSYARGNEELLGTYVILDLMPKGRNEENGLQDWVRHHDKYEVVCEHKCCHS